MKYLAESYLPAAEHDLEALSARVRAAVDEIAPDGVGLRYVEAILVTDDEMCLLLYEADTPDLVRAAGERAGVPCERVMEAT
jgi:hypothetical protein